MSLQILKGQIETITRDLEELKKLPHSTIYHDLLRPEHHPNGIVLEAGELYEEARALMFGGADTTGTTMMEGCFHLLTKPMVLSKLQMELKESWPVVDQAPTWADLEKLPYLVGVCLCDGDESLISIRRQSSRSQ